MTTSEAIIDLRHTLGKSVEDFANDLHLSSRMVYRLENGQQPTTKALLRLADLSQTGGLVAHAELFNAIRATNIRARVKKVIGSQRARRVSRQELEIWAGSLGLILTTCEHAIRFRDDFPEERKLKDLEFIQSTASFTLRDLQTYISNPLSSAPAESST